MYFEPAKIAQIRTLSFGRQRTAHTPTADDLQRRYLTAVLNYVVARIGPGAEAEDVTAEVFVAAFAQLHRCPALPDADALPGDHDPARAYLFGIARRKLTDVYRRRTRHPEEALSQETPAPTGSSPESSLLADEATHTLQAILNALPELQAEVLRLKYLEELSLVEIGIIVRKSPGAVAQLLHRARENARRRGGDYFGTHFAEENIDAA